MDGPESSNSVMADLSCTELEHLADYASPLSPGALVKAVLVFCGIVDLQDSQNSTEGSRNSTEGGARNRNGTQNNDSGGSRSGDREDASFMGTAGAAANITEGTSCASRESNSGQGSGEVGVSAGTCRHSLASQLASSGGGLEIESWSRLPQGSGTFYFTGVRVHPLYVYIYIYIYICIYIYIYIYIYMYIYI